MPEEFNNDVENQVVAGADSVTEGVAEPQSDKELNFAALRDSKVDAERRAREAEDRVRQYEQMMQERQQSKTETQPDENESLDFSDAVDSEAFARISKKFDQQEKRFQQRLEQIEAGNRKKALNDQDPGYIDVINKYLPSVLKDNPAIKDTIKRAPASEQHDLMYQFAKSNKDYVIDMHIKSAKTDNRIVEEEKPPINTLGALPTGSTGTGKTSPLDMDHDSFYGKGGYLSKVLENKVS